MRLRGAKHVPGPFEVVGQDRSALIHTILEVTEKRLRGCRMKLGFPVAQQVVIGNFLDQRMTECQQRIL